MRCNRHGVNRDRARGEADLLSSDVVVAAEERKRGWRGSMRVASRVLGCIARGRMWGRRVERANSSGGGTVETEVVESLSY